MFKLIVDNINLPEGMRHQESWYPTYEKALEHFEKQKALGFWGEEEKTIIHPVIPAELDPVYGNEISPEVPEHTEIIPCEYSYIIEDHTAEVENERVKKETKHTDRLSRVDQLKAIDWTTVDTIAELKAIVKLLVKEAIKDDE